jgi:Flp pilus assembly protein TadD
MASSRHRLIALIVVFLALLATFALTSGWRRRLWEESARQRQLTAEAERARKQQQEKVSEESQLVAALQANPDELGVRLQLAHLRLTLHGAPAALPILEEGERRTNDPRLLRALAECYRLTRREDKALAVLERAAKLAPHDGDVQVDRALLFSLLLWFSEAETALRAAEKLGADPRQIALVQAMTSWQKGDYHKARQVLEVALKKYPNDTLLLRQLAVVANSEGRYAEATKLLEQLAQQNADVESLFALAEAYLQQNNPAARAKAITTVRKVLTIRPQHAQARLLLGRILRHGGQTDEALKVLEALYRDHPKTRGLAFELFEIYRAQGRGAKFQHLLAQHRAERERRAAMRQAVTVFMAYPHRAASHRDMAKSCLEHGLYGRAIIACERALALDPQISGVKEMLAQAREKAQKTAPSEVKGMESLIDGGSDNEQ